MTTSIETIQAICARIKMKAFRQNFFLRVQRDAKDPVDGRIFLQVVYSAPCVKTGKVEEWHGRKWYLSDHMTDDEIFKTAFAAFEAAVKHETMEGFTVDGKILFNPHVRFDVLLSVSDMETSRDIEAMQRNVERIGACLH